MSDPPQLGLGLSHHATGECGDVVTRDLAFDVTLLVEKYLQGPSGEHGLFAHVGRLRALIRP